MSPASSHRTSGTGTVLGPRARMTRAWRSTSRLRTGSTPGGATFTTTRRLVERAHVGQARGTARQPAHPAHADGPETSRQLPEVGFGHRPIIPGDEGRHRDGVVRRTGRVGDRRQPGARKVHCAEVGGRGATVAITARTMDPDPKYQGSLLETCREIEEAGGPRSRYRPTSRTRRTARACSPRS